MSPGSVLIHSDAAGVSRTIRVGENAQLVLGSEDATGRGRAVSLGDAEAGPATVGFRLPFGAAASASIRVGVMGMSKIILQHLQG